jgi:hypothetical protein
MPLNRPGRPGPALKPCSISDIGAKSPGSNLGLYPIVTLQYSSTILYHVSYHMQ